LALGGLGTVEPLGHAQLGEEVLGHLQHGRFGHLRLTRRLRPSVVLAQTLTHRGHPLQRQFGDRPLLLRERFEHLAEMLLTGPQPLRLRPLRQLRRWREVRSVRPVTLT
jgi:hypothetical protein